MTRAKITGFYLGGAAALASIVSFILANWPGKKGNYILDNGETPLATI